MIKDNFKIVLIVFLVVVILSSCQTSDIDGYIEPPERTPISIGNIFEEDIVDTSLAEEVVEFTPTVGGTLSFSMRKPSTLNPILNKDITVHKILQMLFEPIVILDEQLKPQANPKLIEEFVFSENGTSAIITIKDTARWSDGTRVTSNDIRFTINQLRYSPEDSIYKDNIRYITSDELLNENSIRINFNGTFSGMMYLFTFPIIPEHYYSNQINSSSMIPLGNGDYKFEAYVPMEKLILVADRDKFNNTTYIDIIEVLIINDDETDFYAFDQGIVDIVSGNVASWSKYLKSKEYRIHEFVTNEFDFIGFNFNNSTLKEKPIREAIAYATPCDNFIDSIYVGYAKRAHSPVNPDSWLYEEDVVKRDFNMEIASEILETYGWIIPEGQNTRVKEIMIGDTTTTSELNLRILANQENLERIQIAEILKKNLEELGFLIDLEILPFDEFDARIQWNDYDIIVGGFELSLAPNLSFAFESFGNYFNYSIAEMDTLLANAYYALGDENYKNAYIDLQRHISEELPLIGIAFRKSAVIADTKIYGDLMPNSESLYQNIDKVSINAVE